MFEQLIASVACKVGPDSIVIIKGMPVLQCQNCGEYLIEDAVMEKVDSILSKIDKTAELEVLRFAV